MKQLFFLSTLFFLLGCTKKGGNVYLKGRVLNPVTGQGIPNITIDLIKFKPLSGDPFNNGSSKVVKSVTSDANGNYELSHLTSLVNSYSYRVNHSLDYEFIRWSSGEDRFSKKVKRGKNDYVDIELVRYANVNFYFENVNCQGQSDSMRLLRTNLLTGDVLPKGGPYYSFGCLISTNSVRYPEADYQMDWHVIRNGVRTDSSRVFQVRAGQENLIEILY